MNWMPDFMQSTWFLVGMAVVLLALVGVLFVLRNQRQD